MTGKHRAKLNNTSVDFGMRRCGLTSRDDVPESTTNLVGQHIRGSNIDLQTCIPPSTVVPLEIVSIDGL
jgi:hypothetical protein